MNFRATALFTILIGVCISGASGQDKATIEAGKLGGVSKDGVISFKGIPFAAPPVGDLRWRPPQPVAHWKGERVADHYGPDCMQIPFPSDAAPLGVTPSEDCLYANVWRPDAASAKLMPVMVWIYGGGFLNGGSSPSVYDGSRFARQGVVFVSFNYRLGRFGFFAHPALTAESKDGLLGNYAYLDQIAALKWVQKNITAFGGDPSNVTIFGESAGGGSVHAMLTSPLAAGLFQKAIIESGGGRTGLDTPTYIDKANGKKPSAEDTGLAFAKSKGITGTDAAVLKQLRALTADQVLDNLNIVSIFTGKGMANYSGPMIDGKIVTESPDAAYRSGQFNKVPLIVGANNMDIGFLFAKTKDEVFATFGGNADAARTAYDPNGTMTVEQLSLAVGGDRMMIEPARFVAQTVSAHGVQVWEYRFSYVADSIRKDTLGAGHATELPFVFETVRAKYGDKTTPADEKAAREIHDYWVGFAKTGTPQALGEPAWPKYQPISDQIINFTDKGPIVGPDPYKVRLDLAAGQYQ